MRKVIAALLVVNLTVCIGVAIDRSHQSERSPIRANVGRVVQPQVIPGSKKCERISHSQRRSMRAPRPTVLTHTLHVRQFTLRPPRAIGNHVTASRAWRHAGLIKERLATYKLYLTRISAPYPSKNGVPMLHGTPAWVILMFGAAGPENSTGPFIPGRTPAPVRTCIFYNSPLFGIVLAKTGHNFESGG